MKKLIILSIFSFLFIYSGNLSAIEYNNQKSSSVRTTNQKKLTPIGECLSSGIGIHDFAQIQIENAGW